MSEKVTAIDIELDNPETDARASFRIPDDMIAFIQNLEKDHKIVGFEWNGTKEFDILLKKL